MNIRESDMTGDDVREIRRGLGMSQTDLGDELGVAKNTVSRYELGYLEVPKLFSVAIRLLAASRSPKD